MMRRFRRWLAVRLERATYRLEPERMKGWQGRPTQANPSWHARAPRKFANTDKLLAFAEDARVDRYAERVTLDDTTHLARRLPGNEPRVNGGAEITRGLVDYLATSAQYREHFTIQGETADGGVLWSIQMSSAPWARDQAPIVVTVMEADYGSAEGRFNSLRQLLESKSVPMSRRQWRRGGTLLEPMGARDAAQSDREAAISRRSAKIGGVLGFFGGLLGGCIPLLVGVLNQGT